MVFQSVRSLVPTRALLAACSGSGGSAPKFNGKTATAWEVLADDSDTEAPGFSDYSPPGSPFIFDLVETTQQRYNGSWSTLTSPTDDMGDWPGRPGSATTSYLIRNNKVYAYSISKDSWSTLLDTGVPDT